MSKNFPVLHMRSLRKTAMFSEGQRTEGHFRCPGASKPITIIVDLRSEHNLEVLLQVEHADSATNLQVIGLTHRPTGLSGTPTGRTPGSGGGRGSDGRAHATRAARRYADRTRTISHQDPERSPSSRPENCRRGA